MDIDHIFIFTDTKGKIADRLVDFGLTEGSSRIHAGQGTTNRKFYFENFFLEILWVHNEIEITSESLKSTGLWQRANFKANACSPFGLCLVNTDDSDTLFKNSLTYQPDYFPAGLSIDVLTNEDHPQLPWVFRLPFKGQKKNETEPTDHSCGLKDLTKDTFQYTGTTRSTFIDFFKTERNIEFIESDKNWLDLTFNYGHQGLRIDIEELQLSMKY